MHKLQRMERRQQLRPLLLLATMSDLDPLVPLQQEVQTIPHPQEDMLLLLLGETQIRVRDREDRDRMEVHHPLRGSEKQQRQQRPQQLLLMPMQTPMAMPMVREVLQTLLKVKAKDKRLLRWEISSLMMNWTLSCTVSRFTSGSSFFLSFRPSKTSEGGGGWCGLPNWRKKRRVFLTSEKRERQGLSQGPEGPSRNAASYKAIPNAQKPALNLDDRQWLAICLDPLLARHLARLADRIASPFRETIRSSGRQYRSRL
jgi:hypothetical protein